MRKFKFVLLICFTSGNFLNSQVIVSFADSIRQKYRIPELAFAVVSADKVMELQVLGSKKIIPMAIGTDLKADLNDKFRLGSNTKTVTGLLAAILVKQKKIRWDTKFFDLFPELKSKANKAYHDLTLLSLLSFRNKLIKWTYTDEQPLISDIKGNEQDQRKQFIAWIFAQKPNPTERDVNFSNPAYVAAGMMLEKCSAKNYKELVKDLGKQLEIDFDFGPPNLYDSIGQPAAHNADLIPEAPRENIKLNWLLQAGNIQVSLPGFCKFMQEQLRGLAGNSKLLNKEEFEFLFYGLPEYSVGWFTATHQSYGIYSYHFGNPGTFLSKVYVFKDSGKVLILFSNCQSDEADRGLGVLYRELCGKYAK